MEDLGKGRKGDGREEGLQVMVMEVANAAATAEMVAHTEVEAKSLRFLKEGRFLEHCLPELV